MMFKSKPCGLFENKKIVLEYYKNLPCIKSVY